MTARSGKDGNPRSVVILDPDDGSPVIVIAPTTASENGDKVPPAGGETAPPADKK
ncbi:MAG TPA: hypothetical protein VF113_14185 [Stellaceae bacterium]